MKINGIMRWPIALSIGRVNGVIALYIAEIMIAAK
jgi:hypothetical protein